MEASNYTHLFTGSETEALAVKSLLEENHLNYIEKNHVQSGLRSGFGGQSIEIFVLTDQFEKAKKIID